MYDKSGKMIDSWGEGIFEDAHGMCITPDDTCYFVDREPQIVLKFNKQGKHRLTLGTRGVHSDTGYTRDVRVAGDANLSGGGLPMRNGVGYPGPPFHHPTDVSVSASGEIYVSDGYRNSRVHKYSAEGQLLASWGDVGHAEELRGTKDKPGFFHTVHSVWEHEGKVYVADRESNRIQIFTPDGEHLETWNDTQRPTQLQIDADGVVYVAELWRRVGEVSQRLGRNEVDAPARISVLAPDGSVLSRWGGPNRCDPGMLCAPHSLALDSKGDLYVGEVTYTFGVSRGDTLADCHTFQKFARVR